MTEYTEDFADVLGRYLSRAGLTQQELATEIGMHRNTVVSWMNRTSPRPNRFGQVLRIADALALSKEERKELILAANFPIDDVRFWPTEVWTITQRRDTFFTGRDDVLESLHTLLIPGSTTALTQAISGLGGVGKTHTAVEYAYRFHQEYEAVLWLQADSWETLVLGCNSLAKELALPEHKEVEETVAEVQRWLRRHRHWLLILDNMEAEHAQELLERFVPTLHQGCVLITTRLHTLEPFAQTQLLPVMSEQEGVLFLLRRTGKIAARAGLEHASQEQQAEARRIWELVEGLPLALDQAAAFIVGTGCSFLTYCEYFRGSRQKLLSQRGKLSLGHKASVATTFSLAFDRVQTLSPLGAEILQACAFLASDAIPDELFYGEVGSILLGHLSENLDVDEAMGVLHDYSLVQRNADSKTFSIHRLVQAVIQDTLEKEEQNRWAERVVLAVNAVFPDDAQEAITWPQCLRYLEQAQACDALIQQHQLVLTEAADLLNQTGRYTYEHGLYKFAEQLYQRALQIWEQQLGAEHPSVASVLHNLAALYHTQGKYAEAGPLAQRALQIREQQLGAEHPKVAGALNNLAELYWKQGKYGKAELLAQRALQILEQQLGSEHRNVLVPLNILAAIYEEQGKYGEAEPLYQRALQISEQRLGAKHPHMAMLLNNLAELYRAQGEYGEAEPLYQRALQISEQQLGNEHLWVAMLLNNLAELYRAQGEYGEAEPLYQRALQIWKQQLEAKHFLFAHSLTGLAELYREQGKYGEAELLFQRALSLREQVLESHHPDTAETLHGFAALHVSQGNLKEAISLYQRALAIREHVFRSQHPKTVETRDRLRDVFIRMGRMEEAARLDEVQLEAEENDASHQGEQSDSETDGS